MVLLPGFSTRGACKAVKTVRKRRLISHMTVPFLDASKHGEYRLFRECTAEIPLIFGYTHKDGKPSEMGLKRG